MWRAGLDYDHGTGHGVGYYLGVHAEGPQSISSLSRPALQPGMVISNEPGYYNRILRYSHREPAAVARVDTPEGGEHERSVLRR